jgi:hypothetical protein
VSVTFAMLRALAVLGGCSAVLSLVVHLSTPCHLLTHSVCWLCVLRGIAIGFGCAPGFWHVTTATLVRRIFPLHASSFFFCARSPHTTLPVPRAPAVAYGSFLTPSTCPHAALMFRAAPVPHVVRPGSVLQRSAPHHVRVFSVWGTPPSVSLRARRSRTLGPSPLAVPSLP